MVSGDNRKRKSGLRPVLLAILFGLILVYAYQLLDEWGILQIVMDSERLRDWIVQFDYKGRLY